MFQKTAKTTTNAGEKTPANVPQNGNAQSRRRQTELALEAGHRAHQSALPASIETQADRAFTESAPHFQF